MRPVHHQYAFMATTRSKLQANETADVDEDMSFEEQPTAAPTIPQHIFLPELNQAPTDLVPQASTHGSTTEQTSVQVETVNEEEVRSLQLEDLPSWEPTLSYRQALRPPTPPRRPNPPPTPMVTEPPTYTTSAPITTSRSLIDDMNQEAPPTANPTTMDTADDRRTIVPRGTKPNINMYTMEAITAYIEDLPAYFLEEYQINSPYVHPVFDILMQTMRTNVNTRHYPDEQTSDHTQDIWILIHLIGQTGDFILSMVPSTDTVNSVMKRGFPEVFQRQKAIFYSHCTLCLIRLPLLPVPDFNYDSTTSRPPQSLTAKPSAAYPDLIDLSFSPQKPPASNHRSTKINLIGSTRPSPYRTTTRTLKIPPDVAAQPSYEETNSVTSSSTNATPLRGSSIPLSHLKRDHDFSTHDTTVASPPKKNKYEQPTTYDRDPGDLTTRLLKAAKNVGMKPLDLVTDPTLRRTRFNTWSMLLRIVLNSHPETRSMFSDTENISKLNDKVDSCVFQLILAKCGAAAMSSLESSGTISGFQAYIDLRRQCAQVNENLQQAAFQNLLNTHWADNETATAFITRFQGVITKCQHLGMRFSDKDRVRFFIGATHRLTRASPYYVRMELINSRRYDNLDDTKLSDIETNLYGFDEELNNLKNANGTARKAYKEENAYYAQRPSHQRSAKTKSQSHPDRKPYNPDATCTYCNRVGHLMKDCMTKQREQRITPTHQESRQQQRHSSHKGKSSWKPSGHSNNSQSHTSRPSNSSNGHNRRPNQTPTCFKCQQRGHYANECPSTKPASTHGANHRAMLANGTTTHFEVDTKTPTDTRSYSQVASTPIQTAHRASVVQFPSNQPQMLMMAIVPLPNQPFYRQKWWRLHPSDNEHPPQDDFQRYIPDSGATSHFTPVLEDLINPVECRVPILLADGNTVYATQIGYSQINFVTDQGDTSTLHLANVHYVPGLNHRLFSLQAFTRQTNHHAEIRHSNTTLVFEDGATYTWPFTPQVDTFDTYNEHADIAQDEPMPVNVAALPVLPTAEPVAQPAAQPTAHPHTQPPTTPTFVASEQVRPTKTIPLEKALLRLGFRSSRGILAGTYYNLWDDYQIRPGYDSFSTSLRIAISRTHNLSRQPMNLPHSAFELLFMDVIPTPRMRALSVSTAFSSSLLIVDAASRFSMWIGLPKHDSEHITAAIQHYFTRTRSQGRTTQVNYLRADAGSYFASAEFAQWCRDRNLHLSLAAPHHQEMNSICERQWQTINQLSRVLLVHARLPLEYFHFAVRYAIDIINVLPAKGCQR